MPVLSSDRPIMGTFNVKGKVYGWSQVTIGGKIAMEARKQNLTSGQFAVMLSSQVGAQQEAAINALVVAELEFYINQVPEGTKQFVLWEDQDELREVHKALVDARERFRSAGKPEENSASTTGA